MICVDVWTVGLASARIIIVVRRAWCTHFDRHQPACSQFSCAPSVIACLFCMYTCDCVRLYALTLLACCVRYSALRRSLPHLTRTALLTAMCSRPLRTLHGYILVYALNHLACCARSLLSLCQHMLFHYPIICVVKQVVQSTGTIPAGAYVLDPLKNSECFCVT
jgi:hypothetical protein